MRVLVVDDDLDFAEMLVEILRLRGHQAEFANDAGAAEEAVRAACPEVIIMDVSLPSVSGLVLGPRLREATNGVARIIAVTGWSDQATIDASERAGFDGRLTKPIDYAQLEPFLVPASEPSSGPCDQHG